MGDEVVGWCVWHTAVGDQICDLLVILANQFHFDVTVRFEVHDRVLVKGLFQR